MISGKAVTGFTLSPGLCGTSALTMPWLKRHERFIAFFGIRNIIHLNEGAKK